MAGGSSTSLYFDFLKRRNSVSPEMRRIANDATSMSSRIRISSIVSAAATATVYTAFASLGAQAVALISAMGPLVGLLAAVPALLFAAVPGVAALIVGFSGLGAALKRTAGGAGQSAQAIAAAEHRIEMAQRAVTQAQLDLNDARAAAAEQIADYSRRLARARLDEEGALLGVREAALRLAEARKSGDALDRQRADLGYREALQGLAEVRDRLGDVTEEEQRRREAGVEGSDEVRAALQRQADAVYELAQAQAAMAQGAGGVDKAAEAYAKLTDEGRALVDVLRSLGPAWTDVRRATQSALFAGVADDVQALGTSWLPILKTRLAEVAAGWNAGFRGVAQLAATPEFIADMNDALGKTAEFWKKVGASFAPFFSGFRHFTTVGAQYLPRIGAWIQRIGERFDRWAESARRTGKANEWIEKGAKTAGEFWQILKNLGASIVAIFRAGSGGPDWLPALVEGTAHLRAWLESPAGQGKLAAVFETLRDIGSKLWGVATELGPALLNLFTSEGFNTLLGQASDILGFMADHVDDLVAALPYLTLAWAALKLAQQGEVFWSGASFVLKVLSLGVMAKHTKALQANTVALGANAAANGAVAATGAAAGLSMGAVLGIIALFLIAIALMAVEIWYMVTHFKSALDTFKMLWSASLKWIGDQIQMWVDFIYLKWNQLIDWFRNLRILTPGLWGGIVEDFRTSINKVIGWWNNLKLTIPAFSIGGRQLWGGGTISPTPIPYLDGGGRILADGLTFLHRDEEVTPAAEVTSTRRGGRTEVVVRFEFSGAESEFKRFIRKTVREVGGGSAETAFS